MTEFLLTLATLTLGGAVAVLVFAFATRASRTRYGARWRCWIWLLLCLRLLVPFSFFQARSTAHSAPIQISTPSDPVIFEFDFPEPDTPPTTTENDVLPTPMQTPSSGTPVPGRPLEPDPSDPVTESPDYVVPLSEILVLVWIVGMVVMLIWTVISHLRFVRYVRRWSRPMEDPASIRMYNQLGDQLGLDRRPDLRICAGLKAPMLAGIFRPRLLLPENAPQGDELRYTLIHELTHFRRRDIWLKSIALLTNIVHWFNPLMWYMVRLVERDTELACDEAALRQLPPEDHAAYGRTILNAVERLKLKSEN